MNDSLITIKNFVIFLVLLFAISLAAAYLVKNLSSIFSMLAILFLVAAVILFGYKILANLGFARDRIRIKITEDRIKIKTTSSLYPYIIKSIVVNSPYFSNGVKIYTELDEKPHILKKADITGNEQILSIEGLEEEDESTHETIFRTARKYYIPEKKSLDLDEDFNFRKCSFPVIACTDDAEGSDSPLLTLHNFNIGKEDLIKIISNGPEFRNADFMVQK